MSRTNPLRLAGALLTVLLLLPTATPAADHAGHAMPDMRKPSSNAAPSHSSSAHAGASHPVASHTGHGMANRPGQATTPRSPDYSDGIGYPHGQPHMDDSQPLAMLLVEQLEYASGDGADAGALDAQAWWGNDLNKLWFKADAEAVEGELGALRLEVLWDHAFAAFWDTQLGIRHAAGSGPERNWLAFGVQGLAPYFFEIQATAYLGAAGRTAFRFEAEYELLLTQRLILTPDFEINFYGKADPARGLGSGLSTTELGLRLRYEIWREFAPYIGLLWQQHYGDSADFARAADGAASQTRFVIGLRVWY